MIIGAIVLAGVLAAAYALDKRRGKPAPVRIPVRADERPRSQR